MRRLLGTIITAVLVLIAVGCTGSTEVPLGAEPPVGDVEAATGSVSGTKIAQLPATLTGLSATSSNGELLVADRRGLVWRFSRQRADRSVVPVLEEQPILDLSAEVSLLGERGMFSIQLLPDDSGVLVNYTALDGAIILERFPYQSGQVVDRSRGTKVLELPHPYAWHHGGDMAFDPAGDLYVAVGDMEFRQIDPPGPQDPTLMLGGVLRIPADAVSGTAPNWEPSASDMIARGLRNPWRLSFDRKTNDLWIGDVGLDTMEEINRIPAYEVGNGVANFGWPYFEGTRPHGGTPPPGVSFIDPVWEREQGSGICGMVGGFVYRGEWLAGLDGQYVYGDLCSPEVRSLTFDEDGVVVEDRVVAEIGETPVSFGQDAAGELYVLGALGGLYRLDPVTWLPGDNEQEPSEKGPSTTVVPRSTLGCDGLVMAVLPLSELAAIDVEDLDGVMAEVNSDVAAAVEELPDYLVEDGLIVQQALLEFTARLEAAGGDPEAEDVQGLRDEMLAGTGTFQGFPVAMARIVDAECG